MDTVGHRLVLALASRLFYIFDIRKMDAPEQTRESSLKFLTRALACMSDGQGIFPFLCRGWGPFALQEPTNLLSFARLRDRLR